MTLVIRRIGFTSADLERAGAFYGALGFELLDRGPVSQRDLANLDVAGHKAERLRLRLGRQDVEFLAFDPPGRSYPPQSTSTDLWFQHIAIVVADMAEAYARVRALPGHTPITHDGPQTLPANTGGVAAYKFRDPDGHPLEFLAFPPGVGDPAWERRDGPSPFLGIDHSAMVVGDLVRSRAFYEELGFRELAYSLNQGMEQERLDDVDRDMVDVLGLKGTAAIPHLELLAYRIGSRRPIPHGQGAADIGGTRLVLSGSHPAELLRDPDGHLVLFAGNAE